MRVVNIMNFVRRIDERKEISYEPMFQTTERELELVNEYGLENTFLLQYDALIDPNYQKLFKEKATERTELGLWYEIVEPLTTACGMPYNSAYGWKWDWHIVPGFSMAYSPAERERLIDEAMEKFKEVFGYYPKTVASWLIDTHTINYLTARYDISALAICRDQLSTDAYTLVGGYFNQAYYPCKKNLFTPAQSAEERINVPIFRLLGPCPLHNYESRKYISEEQKGIVGCYTMEPVWPMGYTPESVDWYFKTTFENEDLGFSYVHLGQENSFGISKEIIKPLRMQFDLLKKYPRAKVMKMGDAGEAFKARYPEKTPATCVAGLTNWDTEDFQSVYYDCQKYTANIARFEEQIFLRSLFLFDERVAEHYLTETCTTFDAVYENQPLINNAQWVGRERTKNFGLLIDTEAAPFTAEKSGEGCLKIAWNDKSVIFNEEGITVTAETLTLRLGEPTAEITLEGNTLGYTYNGNRYGLRIENATVAPCEGGYTIQTKDGQCALIPEIQ